MQCKLTAVWEAPRIAPRMSIAFKPDVVVVYDPDRDIVTEAFVGQKRRRVARKQQHLHCIAVKALAALALGVKPTFEIDL